MLAIIPARGNSKGVPKKNIKPLDGKPLIIWTIEAASKSKSIDRIILSTDDEEIAELCKNTGIEIPFMRPTELAQDNSLAIDNYLYTIDRLNSASQQNISKFIVLLPTTPLRSSEDIDGAVKLFREKQADSVLSCVAMDHPLDWAFTISSFGAIEREDHLMKSNPLNRQASEVSYIANGGVYVFRYSLLKEKYDYFSKKTYGYVMPPERSVDIDSDFDFKWAEFLVERIKQEHRL
jgi:CMP-N,N'-diacetyllegionaminic acid synthase